MQLSAPKPRSTPAGLQKANQEKDEAMLRTQKRPSSAAPCLHLLLELLQTSTTMNDFNILIFKIHNWPLLVITRPLLIVMEPSMFIKASKKLNLDLNFNLKSQGPPLWGQRWAWEDAVSTFRACPSHRALSLAQHKALTITHLAPSKPFQR